MNLTPAALSVEESISSKTYKKVHAANCGGCADPEAVEFAGGTLDDLADTLAGYATDVDDAETDAGIIAVLLPCAAKVVGLRDA